MVLFINIGFCLIESGVGLGIIYESLIMGVIIFISMGEKVYCGFVDDFFFVDFGGIFDLGDLFC